MNQRLGEPQSEREVDGKVSSGKPASGAEWDALLPHSLALSSQRERVATYSSPDRFIIVGAVAVPFSKLRAYCNCLSFSGSFGTYD
jgi:hypothetical protein